MPFRALLCCFAGWLALVGPAVAGSAERPLLRRADRPGLLFGGRVEPAKARVDSHLVIGPWGSGAACNGQFQDPVGAPAGLNDPAAPNSWTSRDLTQATTSAWHVDTYLPPSGTYAAWCGDAGFASCGTSDPAGGYGNYYDELLEWSATIGDRYQATTLQLSALINVDTEPGYDRVSLECVKRDVAPEVLWIRDGMGEGLAIDVGAVYQPGDYLGPLHDQVLLRFRVVTDGAWSDEDCNFPSQGACQVDDVIVTLTHDGATSRTIDDFEDGVLGGNWAVAYPAGVGDYAQIWSGLDDIDPCRDNPSPQVAFIDDGQIVPGTGGSYCINWCYGPGGLIVNTTGGLAGPDKHLHNAIESPVLPWPDPADDYCRLDFTVFHHEDLSADSPGMFFTWAVRSTAGEDPADIETQPWDDRGVGSHYEGYYRLNLDVSDLMQPGRRFVQVQLAVLEAGFVWGWTGDDGTPGPYFDDVRLTTAPYAGPLLSAREQDLANDGFPAAGTIDPAEPGALSVRFDMAANIAPAWHLRNDPGDSITADITVMRSGATLLPESVRLRFALDANPVFDPYRSSGLPAAGWVPGVPVGTGDRWAFDLPDTGFLFPGDVLHYYLEAADESSGLVASTTLPADLTGFGDFSGPATYDARFTVWALPSLDAGGGQPRLLFWADGGAATDRERWLAALADLGLDVGEDIDLYTTRDPSGGLGNGLGGRARLAQLAGYTEILYASGAQTRTTLSSGDFDADPGDDLWLLDAWLRLGERDLLLTGDGLAADLAIEAGAAGAAFLADWAGLEFVAADLRPLIGNQSAPLVFAEAGNPVLTTLDSWIAYGGCPVLDTFDAVLPLGAAQRLAQFADPTGAAGAYPYAAAVLNPVPEAAAQVVTLPYDLARVYQGGDKTHTPTERRDLLADVLGFFGAWTPPPVDVPAAAARLAVTCWPNPCNPTARIEYTVPGPCRLSLRVYDLRGALVRTLLDGPVAGGGVALWHGDDDAGAPVSSGLYFYEARTPNEVRTGKLTLIK